MSPWLTINIGAAGLILLAYLVSLHGATGVTAGVFHWCSRGHILLSPRLIWCSRVHIVVSQAYLVQQGPYCCLPVFFFWCSNANIVSLAYLVQQGPYWCLPGFLCAAGLILLAYLVLLVQQGSYWCLPGLYWCSRAHVAGLFSFIGAAGLTGMMPTIMC